MFQFIAVFGLLTVFNIGPFEYLGDSNDPSYIDHEVHINTVENARPPALIENGF